MKPLKVTFEVRDLDGSFRRFIRTAPKEAKSAMSDAVSKTTFAVWQRMRARAPVGPDAPHMRDALDTKLPRRDALSGQAGIFDNDDQAHVALYNEYRPNRQPFMRQATVDESAMFFQRAIRALRQVESNLSTGGGLA